MSGFEFRATPTQHTAVVMVTTPLEHIGETMGEAFATVFAALARAGVAPVGPPLCKYLAFSDTSVTYEAGLPVSDRFAGDGAVMAGEVGGCEAAVGLHVGPYDTLVETYGQLQAWLESHGRKPSTVMWECYLDDPDATDPAQLRTEIYWPADED